MGLGKSVSQVPCAPDTERSQEHGAHDLQTERDSARKVGGVKDLSKLSFEDRAEIIWSFEEKYASEFEKRGLKGLSIIQNKE